MGLLSDPEYGSARWVRVLRKIHGPLGVLCYIGALVWFVMLGNRAFNNETYFSENALLPGLVTNGFNGEHSAKTFYNEFLQELEDKYEDTDEMPVPWLVGKMSQLRLEVYTHNFTLNYPLGHGEVYKGTNVYGILRAPRTSSLEALVVTAPYRNTGTHLKGTAAGIALMLAFAEFARPQKYWAKDIIFLVTEHEQLGMQAWLEAYHGIQGDAGGFHSSLGSFWKPTTPSLDLGRLGLGALWGDQEKCLDSGTLKGRSGSIQAAINLELDTPKIQYVEVKVEGLNGQLPNLDLVNLVHKLCVKSGIHHSYKNSYSWVRARSKADEWLHGVTTMLDMVIAQMAGVPNGNHGLFHHFGIEAVTLEGRGAVDPAGNAPRAAALTPANFHRLGSALESILRSLNNLLERFHQSYFFYMLAATDRFISIGQYMPCLCLLCLAMLIRALALWVSIQKDDEDTPKSTKATKSKESNESAEELSSVDQKGKEKKERAKKKSSKCPPNPEPSISIVNIGVNHLTVHLLGYAVMNSPGFISRLGVLYDWHTEVSVYYGLWAISVGLAVFTPLLLRRRLRREEMALAAALAQVELATLCLATGMHNFPLGLCLAALYTPLALIVGVVNEQRTTLGNVIYRVKQLLCLLFHPLAAVTIGMVVYSRRVYPEDDALTTVSRGCDAAMQATMFSVVDSMIYGNWLFNVVATLVLPSWIICWQVLTNPMADK